MTTATAPPDVATPTADQWAQLIFERDEDIRDMRHSLMLVIVLQAAIFLMLLFGLWLPLPQQPQPASRQHQTSHVKRDVKPVPMSQMTAGYGRPRRRIHVARLQRVIYPLAQAYQHRANAQQQDRSLQRWIIGASAGCHNAQRANDDEGLIPACLFDPAHIHQPPLHVAPIARGHPNPAGAAP